MNNIKLNDICFINIYDLFRVTKSYRMIVLKEFPTNKTQAWYKRKLYIKLK